MHYALKKIEGYKGNFRPIYSSRQFMSQNKGRVDWSFRGAFLQYNIAWRERA